MHKTRTDLIDNYEHLRCTETKAIKGVVIQDEISFITKWLKDPYIRSYQNIQLCPPPMVAHEDCFNSWEGFEFDKPESNPNSEAVHLLIYFIETLFKKREYSTYVLNWIADLIQRPGIKPSGAALLLYSKEEGTGKNTFTTLLEKLVGTKYSYSTSDPARDLYGEFNDLRVDRLAIVVDEADATTSFANNDKMKSMLTEKKFTANPKGQKRFETQDLSRYVFTTNNSNSVKITDESRRFSIFEVSDKFVKDRDSSLFDRIYETLEDDSCMADIFAYFKTYPITLNIVKDKPITDMHNWMKKQNIPLIKKFLSHYIHESVGGEFFGLEIIERKRTELYNAYNKWLLDNKFKEVSSKAFDEEMRPISDPTSNGKVTGIDRPEKKKNNAVYFILTVDENLMKTIEEWN